MPRIVCVNLSLLCLILFGLSACQKLTAPEPKVSEPSNVIWKSISIKRNTLSTMATNYGVSSTKLDVVDGLKTEDALPAPEGFEAPAPLTIMDPNNFISRPTSHITRAFGEPTMIRQEGLVQVWQYRLTRCVVDFFIYTTDAGKVIEYVDMRSQTLGGKLDELACRTALYVTSQK